MYILKRISPFSLFILLSLFVYLCYISIISPLIPISYDEAWNWTHVASLGPWYALTNYPAANNHVFFSFLQSILTPRMFLWYYPEVTRVVTILTVVSFFILVWYIFSKFFKKQSVLWFIVIIFVCFFCSPLITPFFIISRGYLLGAFFLLTGVYLLTKEKYFVASFLFILSAWTVPTYAYCLPLLYIVAFFLAGQKNKRKFFFSVFLTIFSLLLVYLPILSAVLIQGKIWHTGTFIKFLYDLWNALSNYPYTFLGNIFNSIYLLAYCLSVFFLAKSPSKEVKNFFLLLTITIVGYIVMVGILSLLHKADPPFLRVSLFIPLFMSIAILAVPMVVKNIHIKVGMWLLLLINCLIGMCFFTTRLPFTFKRPYPILADYLVPVPFPISLTERLLLKEKKVAYIPLTFPLDDSVVYYFSSIYHVPVKNLITISPSPTPSHVLKVPESHKVLSLRKEPIIFILPTNPLYPLKKIGEQMWLFVMTIWGSYEGTKKPRIEYLLTLSDTTYAEADILWRKKEYTTAIETLSHAENDMTMASLDAKNLIALKGYDDDLINEMVSSVQMHKNILTKLARVKSENAAVVKIRSFCQENLYTIQALYTK